MSIAVIAGLGNPGLKYRNTRHNIGFSVVDSFAASLGAKWKTERRLPADTASALYKTHNLLLVKPQTFMNSSGQVLAGILNYRKLPVSALLIIYDDITLELGRSKLSLKGSAGGHNGVADILSRMESGFLRYRIGIGAKPHAAMELSDYVLGKFSPDELNILADRTTVFLEHLQLIIDKGSALAMNFINQRTSNKHERTN